MDLNPGSFDEWSAAVELELPPLLPGKPACRVSHRQSWNVHMLELISYSPCCSNQSCLVIFSRSYLLCCLAKWVASLCSEMFCCPFTISSIALIRLLLLSRLWVWSSKNLIEPLLRQFHEKNFPSDPKPSFNWLLILGLNFFWARHEKLWTACPLNDSADVDFRCKMVLFTTINDQLMQFFMALKLNHN